MSISAVDVLKQDAQSLTDYFKQVLSRYADAPPRLMEAISYSLLAGGKRLRPSLALQFCRACAPGNLSAEKSALAAAAAMELIHTFSLVHDDLPAMDNDDLRRGRPTNHKVFGEAVAILAGDAMVTIAFELIAADADPRLVPALVKELAAASGPEGMIGGQVLDIDGEGKSLRLPELQRLHSKKTGALLTASCRLGALAANASPEQLAAATHFGQHLGLAFQIVDDILDETSTPEQLGKATKKDAAKGKNTYPVLLGMEASQKQAKAELAAALHAIDPLGPAADILRELAKFVVERQV